MRTIIRLAALLLLATSCASSGSLTGVYRGVRDSVVMINTLGAAGPSIEEAYTQAVWQPSVSSGVGSGVIISEDGSILTAAHVVQTAQQVQVQFSNGMRRRARVVSSNSACDLALIQLDDPLPPGAVVASLGDSDRVPVASPCFVIGAPRGIGQTLTVGYISARRRSPNPFGPRSNEFFQTDAAINRGNSGGPLFDMNGEVIGIVSYIVSESGGSEGLGFAVTSNLARELMVDEIPFWSGMTFVMIDESVARLINSPGGRGGLLVQLVVPGGFGEELGLRPGKLATVLRGEPILLGGDLIVAVLGIDLSEPGAFLTIDDAFRELGPSDPFTLTVVRDGETVELSAKRAPAPSTP